MLLLAVVGLTVSLASGIGFAGVLPSDLVCLWIWLVFFVFAFVFEFWWFVLVGSISLVNSVVLVL